MKLGPFVTSKASIGASSAAAGQDVRNAINTGYNKMQNSQTAAQFGSQMMKTSIAADLNKQRATVAAAENNARSAIEQNPDYIDADIVEDMGVEVDEANVIEDENGKRRVRTYSVAEELYSKSVEAGVTEADNRLSFPSVGKRLNDEVSAKYRNAGQNKVATWAVHKQRDLTRQENEVTLDDYRGAGQYDEAMETISTMEAAGVFSPAQAESQRDRTRVSKEMRSTNNLIVDAQKDVKALPELDSQIARYEAALDDPSQITNGMTSDQIYSERNRMLAARTGIVAANTTKQSVDINHRVRELRGVTAGLHKGVTTISATEIQGHAAYHQWMVQNDIGSPAQRNQLGVAVSEARIMAENSPEFAELATGSAHDSERSYHDLQDTARNMPPGQAADAVVLLDRAGQAYTKRLNMLSTNPAKYAVENNPEVSNAYKALVANPGDPEAMGDYLDAQLATQVSMGVPVNKQRAFDPNSPFVTQLAASLTTGAWGETQEVIEGVYSNSTPEQIAFLAKSLSSTDRGVRTAQMVLQTYGDDPAIAQKIAMGSQYTNQPLNTDAFKRDVVRAAGDSVPGHQLDAMMPGLEAYYRWGLANKVEGYDAIVDPNNGGVNEMMNTLFGEEVSFKSTMVSRRFGRDDAFPNSPPTRPFRDPISKQYFSPEAVRDSINAMAEDVASSGESFLIGRTPYPLERIAENARVVQVGEGKYQLQVRQPDGRDTPVMRENGETLLFDLKEGLE